MACTSVGKYPAMLVFAIGLHVVAAQAASHAIVYSFCSGLGSCSDGAIPGAGLIDVDGILYGTTTEGGNDICGNCGKVFALDPKTGEETVLYSFSGADGMNPVAGLTDVNGTFYGTTYYGGTAGWGVVFAVDGKTYKGTVLHSFTGGADGGSPAAGLIEVKGTLYGTAQQGGGSGCGGSGCGTVFAMDPGTGNETVLHSFTADSDGAYPIAGLIGVKGVLYGTTNYGGGSGCGGAGCGTVFALDPKTGKETVLHSFAGNADGASPAAGLLNLKDVLYSTTVLGGGTGCGGQGCGTVFALDLKSGKETIPYSFAGTPSDGEYPYGGLIDVKGNLYGTTSGGSDNGCGGSVGCGTVFVLDPKTNKERVIYSMAGGRDNLQPLAGLVRDASGELFGTTAFGGTEGYGTIFSVKR